MKHKAHALGSECWARHPHLQKVLVGPLPEALLAEDDSHVMWPLHASHQLLLPRCWCPSLPFPGAHTSMLLSLWFCRKLLEGPLKPWELACGSSLELCAYHRPGPSHSLVHIACSFLA